MKTAFVRTAALVAALVVTMATVACTKRSNDIEVDLPGGEKITLKTGETLRINIVSEPPSLDWHKSADTTSSLVTGNVMEGLVNYNLADRELGLIPGLALKWEPSDQAKKWKFTLRDGIAWSDGQPFTAQHVLDGWKRLLTKETAAEYAYFLFPIKNAKAYNEGKVPWEQVGVKITAPNEISVELDKSMGYFPSLMTHHSTYPIRLDVVAKHGDKWTEPQNIVTLGAFNLKVWQHDKMLVMERNEKYFGDKAKVKYVAGYMIQEQSTAINLFDSNKLDSVHRLPSIELRKLKDRPEHRQENMLVLYYYGINTGRPPMDNLFVRKAVAAAIDRQQIVQMLAGGQVPLSNWIPPGVLAYEANIGSTFDPEKAKALLKQAGYADVSKFPTLEIKFNTNENHQRIAENVQAQLKKNLGINVELKNEEWKVYLNTLKTDPPHLFRFGWLADYPDPDNFMTVMASFSDNNHTKWKSLKFDELIMKAAGALERETRKAFYAQAQKLMVEDDVPVIPLFSDINHLLVSPRVKNYPINIMEKYEYKGVELQ